MRCLEELERLQPGLFHAGRVVMCMRVQVWVCTRMYNSYHQVDLIVDNATTILHTTLPTHTRSHPARTFTVPLPRIRPVLLRMLGR